MSIGASFALRSFPEPADLFRLGALAFAWAPIRRPAGSTGTRAPDLHAQNGFVARPRATRRTMFPRGGGGGGGLVSAPISINYRARPPPPDGQEGIIRALMMRPADQLQPGASNYTCRGATLRPHVRARASGRMCHVHKLRNRHKTGRIRNQFSRARLHDLARAAY